MFVAAAFALVLVACASQAPTPEVEAAVETPPETVEAALAVEETRRAEEELERVPAVVLAALVDRSPAEPPPGGAVLEITFAEGAARLDPEARAALDDLTTNLPERYRIALRSQTLEGDLEASDWRLAQRRLAVVQKYLHREKNIPLEHIGLYGVPGGEAVAAATGEPPLLVVVRFP
jgi:hypothetical protein